MSEQFDELAYNALQEYLANELTSRVQFYDRMFDKRRDINKECGFPENDSTAEQYHGLYYFDAIANRVVEAMPRECFQNPPLVYDTNKSEATSAFEQTLAAITQDIRGEKSYHKQKGSVFPLAEFALRADINSRIGQYGIMVFITDDGRPLNEPAEGYVELNSMSSTAPPDTTITPVGNYSLTINAKPASRKLKQVRIFPEALAPIVQFESNRTSPRFGLPIMYQVRYNDPLEQRTGIGVPMGTEQVHWTRVIHIAETKGSSELFAGSAMRPCRNNLLSLQKIYGAAAEGYWQSCFTALSIETNPALGGNVQVDVPKLRRMMESFRNGLQRELFLKGLTAKTLAPSVTDPTSQIAIQIEAICIAINMPVPVFKGYEIGEQASTNNDSDFNDRVKQRMQGHCTERILIPMVDKLINLGVVAPPKETYVVEWPDITAQSAAQRAQTALTTMQSIVAYISGGAEALLTPMDLYTRILGWSEEDAEAVLGSVEDGPDVDIEVEPTANAVDVFAELLANCGGKGGKPGPCAQPKVARLKNLTKLQQHKIAVLNPDGPVGGVLKVPKAISDEYAKSLAKDFPGVTKITKVNAAHISLSTPIAKKSLSTPSAAPAPPPVAPSHASKTHSPLNGVKLPKLQEHKVNVLNPNGPEFGKFKVPKATSDEAVAKIQANLPPGVKVEKVNASHITMDTPVPKKLQQAPTVPPPVPAPAPAPAAKGQYGWSAANAPDVGAYKVIDTLPGSTKPKLIQTPDGKKHVLKSSASTNEGHVRSETAADAVYTALGIDVPKSKLVTDGGKISKQAEYIEGGQTLAKWKAGKSQAEVDAMHKEIGKNFVLDAVLGNRDVIGLSSDNILIKDGKPYRIDNGGALEYRAQGALKKDFDYSPTELKTLRDPSINPTAAAVFGHLTNADITAQAQHLVANKDKILAALSDLPFDTQQKIAKRIDNAVNFVKHENTIALKKLAAIEDDEGDDDDVTPKPGKKAKTEKGGKGVTNGVINGFPPGKIGDPALVASAMEAPVKGKLEVKRTPHWDLAENKAWAASLTSDEHYAISYWKGSATSIRAAYARGEHLKPGTTAYNHHQAILKAKDHEGVVFRGIHGIYAETVAQACIAAGVGGEWSDVSAHGFSANPSVGMHFSHGETMLRVHVKTAKPIHKGGDSFKTDGTTYTSETEVLGQPGVKYKIKAVHQDITVVDPVGGTGGGTASKKVKYIIDLEEI